MRTALHRVESDCFKLIYDNESTKEETLELVVPDVCGDIGKILDTRGQLCLTSKKASGDEVVICSSAEVSVIYAAEDSGEILCINAVIPFEQSFTIKGADEAAGHIAQTCLCGLEAKALNPRKLLIRVEAKTKLRLFAADKFVLWDGIDGCEAPTNIYLQKKELEHNLIVGIHEKTFTVSDEYSLPNRYTDVKMLSANTELCVIDVKSVGNKLVFKANANTIAVFLNKTDNSLFKCELSSQFSQIIESDARGDEHQDTVFTQLKELEFIPLPDRETVSFSVRMNICAQAVCMEEKCSVYVSDAYSNDYELKTEYEEKQISKLTAKQTVRLSAKGKLCPKGSLNEILYIAPVFACCEVQGNEICCTVKTCGVAVVDDGALESLEAELKGRLELTLPENGRLHLLSACCDPVVLEQGMELCVDVCVEYCIFQCCEIYAVSSIELNEEAPKPREGCPSLVVLCSHSDMDTWMLAKKYGSTIELIEGANCGDGEFCVSRRPLLIPKA